MIFTTMKSACMILVTVVDPSYKEIVMIASVMKMAKSN